MSDIDTFRRETRTWLDANCPADMRTPALDEDDRTWGGRNPSFKSAGQKRWFDAMVGRGWTAPEWPVEYGGGGLSKDEAGILREEMRALGCRSPLDSMGIWMLGPALLKYGSEVQKSEHLPKIVRGEIRWCQGYSEPGAGSDLASLQTKAEDKGDHYLVNGQKTWTSHGDKADWIFCLVRTDAKAKKQEGISFMLFDMTSPGVSTKPIVMISGKSPFCETFFTDVKVPKENLIGEENRGWDIAKYLLAHERENFGDMDANVGQPLGRIAADVVGTVDGRLTDTILRAELARYDVDSWAFQAAVERANDLAAMNQMQPAMSSILKYYGSELNKRRHELFMNASGSDALEWESERSAYGEMPRAWLRSKGNSIEGGTSEVQLSIIAKRLLELPGG